MVGRSVREELTLIVGMRAAKEKEEKPDSGIHDRYGNSLSNGWGQTEYSWNPQKPSVRGKGKGSSPFDQCNDLGT